MKVQVLVEFNAETRGLEIKAKGDPLLVLTALDLAHGRILLQLNAGANGRPALIDA